jgi:formate dehydrogenase assembly factor FdhD
MSHERILSEMQLRTASMGAPIVASRTALTNMATSLTDALNAAVCGDVRPGGLNLSVDADVVLENTPAWA